MLHKIVGLSLLFALSTVFGVSFAAQEHKKGARIIGELKSMKDTKDGKNTNIEVLAPGEVKARRYFVQYDPKIKAPIPDVLKAVRAAKVGDTVELEWVPTNHGPAIISFRALKKGTSEQK